MALEDEIAKECELDRRAAVAARDLLRICAELGWGSPEPLAAAVGRLTKMALAEGYACPADTHPARRPRIGAAVTRQVWDRDGWECRHCGTHRNLTVDHVVPVSRGGADELANLQTLCGPCNSSKGSRPDGQSSAWASA